MYRNKDIPNELMELVKSRYMVHKKNGMGFFEQKLINCYELRVGEELVNKFNMQTSMAEIEQVKEARLARLEDERRQRQAAQEEDERRQRKGYSAKSRKEFKGKLGRGLGRRRFYCPRREGGGGGSRGRLGVASWEGELERRGERS